MAEIIERLLSVGLLPDSGINIQPDQEALRIVIHAAAPILKLGRSAIKELGGIGGVLQRTPGASDRMVEHGSGFRSLIKKLRLGP